MSRGFLFYKCYLRRVVFHPFKKYPGDELPQIPPRVFVPEVERSAETRPEMHFGL